MMRSWGVGVLDSTLYVHRERFDFAAGDPGVIEISIPADLAGNVYDEIEESLTNRMCDWPVIDALLRAHR